jgi:hypothetical protein
MIRILAGSIAGGLAQFLIGFLFWGTPLANIAFTVAGDAQNADVQAALARDLGPTGTGAYYVPWPDTAQGTVLHGKGPVALIFFNTGGFPLVEISSLVTGADPLDRHDLPDRAGVSRYCRTGERFRHPRQDRAALRRGDGALLHPRRAGVQFLFALGLLHLSRHIAVHRARGGRAVVGALVSAEWGGWPVAGFNPPPARSTPHRSRITG